MSRGLFISFEGIEGCGKTTQIERLSAYLASHGHDYIVTREPGGTAVGEGIRNILLESEAIHLTVPAELLLFYASRSQNIEERIRPSLDAGATVICDRFYHASMAYQGYGRGIPVEFIEKLTDLVCGDFRPDLTILLDIEPGEGLERARRRNSVRSIRDDRFEAESLAFYSRVRAGYLDMADRERSRIHVIDASQSIEAISGIIRRLVDERL